MNFETHLFGNVDVSEEKIITFPNGLIGFEGKTRFMLIHELDEKGLALPTFTLQSVEDGGLALQIVDPALYGFHYELVLSDEEANLLKNPALEDLTVMQVVYKSGENNVTASLRAPIIINTKARVGLQKLIEKLGSNVILSNLSNEV